MADVVSAELPDQDPELNDFTAAVPSDDLVEAVMALYSGGTWVSSDAVAESENQTPSILEGAFFKNIDVAVLPERVQQPDQLNKSKKEFWFNVLTLICREAQKRSFADPQKPLDRFVSAGIKNLRVSHAHSDLRQGLYFNVDTSSAQGSEPELIDAVAKTLGLIRTEVRAAVISVLANTEFMATIFRTATVNNKINRRTLFKDDIRRLELIRNRVEKPQDQKRFLSILQQAAKEAGYDDVKVELLSVEDAFFHGCKGLYKERKGHATVAIPMSYYGTTRLLSLPEAFEILAHELGHHETRKAKTDHDLDHTIATEEIGAKLKGLTTGRDYKVRRVDGPLVSYEKKKWKRNDNLLKLTMFISTLLLAGIGGFSLYQAAQQRGMIDDLTAEVAKVTKGLDSFVNSKTPSKAAPEAPFRPSRKDKRSHE